MKFVDRLDKQFEFIIDNERIRDILYVYRKGDAYTEKYLDLYKKNYGYPFGRIASCDELIQSDFYAFRPDKELYVIYLTSESEREEHLYDPQTNSNIAWKHSQHDLEGICEYFQSVQMSVGLSWIMDVVYLQHRHNSTIYELQALNGLECNKVWVVQSDMNRCIESGRDQSMDFLGMMSILMLQNRDGYRTFLSSTVERAVKVDMRCFDMVGIQQNIQIIDNIIWRDLNHGIKGDPSDETVKQVFDYAIQRINNYMHVQLSALLVGLDYFPVFSDAMKNFKGREIQLGYALKLMYGDNRDMWQQVYDLSYENVCDRLEEAWHDESLADIFSDIPYGFWTDIRCHQMLIAEHYRVMNMDMQQVLTSMNVKADMIQYRVLPTKYNNVTELVRTVDYNGFFKVVAELALEKAVWKYIKIKMDDARDNIDIKNLAEKISRQIEYLKDTIPGYTPNMKVTTQTEFLQLCVDLQKQDINKQWNLVGSKFNMMSNWVDGRAVAVNGINDNTIFMVSVMPV